MLAERSGVSDQTQPVPVISLQQKQIQYEIRPKAPALDVVTPVQTVDSKPSGEALNAEVSHSLEELWERILADLLKNNKRAIHTCLLQGELLAVTPENVTLGFQLSFYKERVEKEDYRGFLEKLITQITGKTRPIRCYITSETEHPGQVFPRPETPEDNPLVRDAVAMFGEMVVTIEKNK
jgi:DNA polymerase-3 subunit gamma/tau